MSWRRPRGRLRLDGLLIPHHAVGTYLERVPGACPATARADLAELAHDATLLRRTPTEAWEYACGDLRLFVHRPARRAPILLTVTWEGTP